MTDIVERLRIAIDSDVNEPIDHLLEDALAEIERLRGAQTSGPSFREIKEDKSHLWRPESGTSL